MNEDELSGKLNELLLGQREMIEGQQELLMMMTVRNTAEKVKENPEWLSREEVIDYKCYSQGTFYRRQKENENVWIKEKRNGVWHYLKSSLL